MKKKLTIFWLLLSSFGIMFAVLSWIQESQIISAEFFMGYKKGVWAILTGLILYNFVAKKTLN